MATGDVHITIDGLDTLTHLITGLHTKIDELERIMATQDDIDRLSSQVGQLADRFTAALADIRGDIAALKAQGVDVAALEANINRLGSVADDAAALAGENPPSPGPTGA